jgi:serine/threonine protein kinase
MMANKPLDAAAVFRVARQIESAEARAEYLAQICGHHPGLHDRVATLLHAHDEEPDFLESPPTGVVPTIDFPTLAERPGTQIGPYKLHQEIGEGGMGIVYMALQREPVRRKVALKIIKPGMDTREVIARFSAEKQALAIMDHPNIAKVHDAGTTESGRPYFVMELVNGVTLTQYCDDNHLTTDQRLELFVPICHAVQHAHQKGIIHRDLKPANILVTLHDGVPVPKIIDFGIAKATNQELTSQTLATGYGQMVGTPLYMSPEQAERSGLDIDTRSDIYSLGVLLYELLTGSTPFSRDQFKDAGLDEVRRLIREEEPPRPSTRISTMGKAATTVSEHRKTDPVELSNSLRHELDWIVMRAMEKDRMRRYQTANDFARDIQRYLDDEPVEACPPSTVYRLKKFTRRHKTAVLATTAVALAVILGAGVAAGQAYRATKAEKLAEEQLHIAKEQKRLANEQAELAQKQKRLAEEAAARENELRVQAEEASRKAEAARQRAETVADYLVDVFRSPDPERDGRTVTVVEVMDRLQGELDTKFSEDALLRAKLSSALGKTYLGLGIPQKALDALLTSYELHLRAEGDKAPSTLRSLVDLMDGYSAAGRYKDALVLGEKSLETHQTILGQDDSSTLKLSDGLVEAYLYAHRNDDAVRLGEQLLPLARKSLGPRHAITRSIMNDYAWALNAVGQCQAAMALHEELLDTSMPVHQPHTCGLTPGWSM